MILSTEPTRCARCGGPLRVTDGFVVYVPGDGEIYCSSYCRHNIRDRPTSATAPAQPERGNSDRDGGRGDAGPTNTN